MYEVVPPYLLEEFHSELNNGKELTSKTPLGEKLTWTCPKGHNWEATLGKRIKGGTCLVCSNRVLVTGVNDLKTLHPFFAAEWSKKNDKEATMVVAGGNQKVIWEDKHGHEWETTIGGRIQKNTGCPVCAGLKIVKGFNDLQTLHPKVAKEWHPTKNKLSVFEVAGASHKKVWWLGKCSHEWEASIAKRTTMNRGCPICANHMLAPGINDMLTRFPELSSEWHPTKNGDLKPNKIFPGTSKKYWWQCSKGHEWEASPNKRTSSKRNCPLCSNQKIQVGINDLNTTHPKVATEWHPTKNGDLKVENISKGYTKKVWWLGKCGHEWETKVADKRRYNCPKCPHNVSKAEKEITQHLKRLGLFTENNSKLTVPGIDLDIYVPDKKTAIEYNGLYWHTEDKNRTKEFHYNKWQKCKENGITLFQIWEDDWQRDSQKILKSLEVKLGVSSFPKVFARKTKVELISYNESKKFLQQNHIQGSARGSYYFGLKNKQEQLVAVLVLQKENNGKTFIIARYATSLQVVGGFTKLLSHIEKNYEFDEFVTFSDHCISDGSLYKNNGFTSVKEIEPDYMYVVKNQRKHKFGYRLSKFRSDPSLQYKEGLTEKELAQLNNLPRIWDAGKTKWVRIVKQPFYP